ncbi:MAG: hypothetical protein R2818_14640 [Flavobacteriales bacterium]
MCRSVGVSGVVQAGADPEVPAQVHHFGTACCGPFALQVRCPFGAIAAGVGGAAQHPAEEQAEFPG